MSTVLRGTHYRHKLSAIADWVVIRRHSDGNVTIHSNVLNTDLTIPESDLVVADRSESPPLLLGLDGPGTSHGFAGLSAAGASSPAASSVAGATPHHAPATYSPVPSSSVSTGARPNSSPGKGGQPLARTSDPQTAHDAAVSARANAASNRMRVLIAHANAGASGLTGWELEQVTGLPYETLGPRRPALEADGLISITKERRPNGRGNLQAVYRITDNGRNTARTVA